jgi:hypothetical protein
MLRQYAVAAQQAGLEPLPKGFCDLASASLRACLALDRRPDAAETRREVWAVLRGLGYEANEGLAVHDLGYVLSLKLREQPITVEVCPPPKCVRAHSYFPS